MAPSMYAQSQQYQQGAAYEAATQQPAMVWNGSSWVPQNQQQQTTFSTHTAHVTNTQTPHHQNAIKLQTQYTNYYHGWKAKEDAERRLSASLYGDTKQEAERQASWAKYYSEQASRAAHHYHNHPMVPFPHQLPPAPPPTSSESSQRTQNHSAGTVQSPNDAMKEFVHRSLKQCEGKAKDALEDMQKQVELMISQVCQDGTMHKIDWENKPLLSLPAKYRSFQPQTMVHSKYGGSSSPTTVSKRTVSSTSQAGRSDILDSQSPSNSSHYGSHSSQVEHDGSSVSPGMSFEYVRAASNAPRTAPNHRRYLSNKQGRDDDDKEQSDVNSSYYGPSVNGNDQKVDNSGQRYNTNRGANDFIELPVKKRKKKQKSPMGSKKLKMVSSSPDGFERNARTLSERASRFAGAGGLKDASTSRTSVDSDVAKYMGGDVIGGKKDKLNENDFERMKVKGTCLVLEKDYLRLTAPPRAELVRPPAVLEKHLQNLREEWKLSPSKRRDYVWFCSQLKAIRQDLTVQQVFTAFTVAVYEFHARIALQELDLNEFNQCQTQLKELYGSLQDEPEAVASENEFLAYRLLYYVFLTGNKKYEEGSTDLFKIMLTLDLSRRSDPIIAHALKVRESVAEFNYHKFFRLSHACPTKHGELLMKFLVPNVRKWALRRICKSYRPSVETNFVVRELGFESMVDGRQWLESCGCVFSGGELNTKETVVRDSDMKEQNSLI